MSTFWGKIGEQPMGWLHVLLPLIAAFLYYRTSHTLLMVIAIIMALGSFWSWGVMHNYATDVAKHRSNYTGGFYDLTKTEAESVPNWLATVDLLFSLVGFVLFIIAIVLIVRA
jgi:hypothetical protein